jgi:hypothetical protein
MVERNGVTSVDVIQRAGKEDKKAAITLALDTSFMSIVWDLGLSSRSHLAV